MQAMMGPINQFYFTTLVKETRGENNKLYSGEPFHCVIWKYTKSQVFLVVLLMSIACVVIYVASVVGTNMDRFYGVLWPTIIMSFSVLIGVLNYMYGMIGLAIKNHKKPFSKMTALTGLFSILLSFSLCSSFSENGAALAYTLSELLLLLLVGRFYIKNKI